MFLLSIRVVAVALVVFSVSVHSAELKAPLGLQWGQTQEQLEAKGVKYETCGGGEISDFGTVCLTLNPPKPISFASGYSLSFNPGLQWVAVYAGKNPFAPLYQRLAAKYGEPHLLDEDERMAVWEFGDAKIVLDGTSYRLVIKYISKDVMRLFEEASALRIAKDDAGL